MLTYYTRTPDETRALAARLAAQLAVGDVILLDGALGAGKTTFVQGLAKGLGVEEPVTSPTFTLIHEYSSDDDSRALLIHFDLYRLERPNEIEELGFADYLERDSVMVVEWADKLGALTPPDHLRVRIEIVGGDERRFTLLPRGSRAESMVGSLRSSSC